VVILKRNTRSRPTLGDWSTCRAASQSRPGLSEDRHGHGQPPDSLRHKCANVIHGNQGTLTVAATGRLTIFHACTEHRLENAVCSISRSQAFLGPKRQLTLVGYGVSCLVSKQSAAASLSLIVQPIVPASDRFLSLIVAVIALLLTPTLL
jgi:hypothetical protein